MTRDTIERVRGKWRVTEVEDSPPDILDTLGAANIELAEDRTGIFRMANMQGVMDFMPTIENRKPAIEFTWEGLIGDEYHSGRGFALTDGKFSMMGQFWVHMGGRVFFKATKWGRWLYDERMKK